MDTATGLTRIGDVADKLKVSTMTIKCYEELRLIKPGTCSPGGFKLYREEDVGRLRRILDEKNGFLSDRDQRHFGCTGRCRGN